MIAVQHLEVDQADPFQVDVRLVLPKEDGVGQETRIFFDGRDPHSLFGQRILEVPLQTFGRSGGQQPLRISALQFLPEYFETLVEVRAGSNFTFTPLVRPGISSSQTVSRGQSRRSGVRQERRPTFFLARTGQKALVVGDPECGLIPVASRCAASSKHAVELRGIFIRRADYKKIDGANLCATSE